ncbi:MAG: nucleoid-associated protein [Flavobacteriales bacterium]
MLKIDTSRAELNNLITHHVGNKHNEESISLTAQSSEIFGESMDYVMSYFLSPFKNYEFFQFSNEENLELNQVFKICQELFKDADCLVEQSQNLAKLLYEASQHPNIRNGELNVALFSDVVVGGEIVDAIGIFKSESNTPFLTMKNDEVCYTLDHEIGFDLKGIDKACLVLNTEEEQGYKVIIVDKINKGGDALYWKETFLGLTNCVDEYHSTKDFLTIAQTFVSDKLEEDFQVDKTDKMDLLNRSIDYFKENKEFDKEEFEVTVFQDESVIKSFREYDEDFREEYDLKIDDKFEISNDAVKKQNKNFKSILKLDKNFSVYVHGNKEMIERGVDEDGRKYYKLYYENEI